MELRHLRYFVRVAEEENVSRAALKLHVSQPALSRQIRDLEDELGFPLLERSAKSVRLTEAGRVFLTECRAVLQRVEQAVNAARSVARNLPSELHIGYAPTVTARILPPALRSFQSAMPRVRVKLHDLSTEEMLAGLREGKLQLALSVRPMKHSLNGLRFDLLLREPLCLAVSPSHPLANRAQVPLAEAVREPFIAYSRADYPDYHRMLGTVFAKTKIEPRIAEEHDGVSSLISAVEVGHGVAVVPQSTNCVAGPRLKFLRLSPEPAPLEIGIILPKSRPLPAPEQFIRALNEVMRDSRS